VGTLKILASSVMFMKKIINLFNNFTIIFAKSQFNDIIILCQKKKS